MPKKDIPQKELTEQIEGTILRYNSTGRLGNDEKYFKGVVQELLDIVNQAVVSELELMNLYMHLNIHQTNDLMNRIDSLKEEINELQ